VDIRYARSGPTLTDEDIKIVMESRIVVVGCGGLGCYAIEQLARLGIGHLTVVDAGVFEISNLNRQLYATMDTIGLNKAMVARDRIREVNPEVSVTAHASNLSPSNARTILRDHQVIIDALDNVKDRLLLHEQAEALGIPLVHGAIGDWYGQVATVFPGENTLSLLYSGVSSIDSDLSGNPPFVPALVASIQVVEAVKILLGRGSLLRGNMLRLDTLNHDYDVLQLRCNSRERDEAIETTKTKKRQ
jgi:molybdopterin/thiamine biosynthesis adenylyltransferase